MPEAGREFITKWQTPKKTGISYNHSLKMSSVQMGLYSPGCRRWEKALGSLKVTTAGTTVAVELSQA